MKAPTKLAILSVLSAAGLAFAAPGPDSASAAKKDGPVKFERIAGSPAKRVILTPKAAERLGIEAGKVSEGSHARTQVVGGLVIPPVELTAQPKAPAAGGVFGGFASVAAAAPAAPVVTKSAGGEDEAWVLVTLTPGEWERLAKDKPARLTPLFTRGSPSAELMARPSGMPPGEDTKRTMVNAYYVLPGKKADVSLHQRIRVELPIQGAGGAQKVVPYSAVYYDAKGESWVYVISAPYTYERQRIKVDRIEGERALLHDGPAVGTPIVTVGAAMLFGTEVFGK